jgi:hypothetical protein
MIQGQHLQATMNLHKVLLQAVCGGQIISEGQEPQVCRTHTTEIRNQK